MTRLEFDSIEIELGGRRLLTGVYMCCERGAITALLGRNGCGKSTLLKIVFGAMNCSQKSVRVDGRTLGLHYMQRRAIAYLPQSGLIPSYLTMRQAISLFRISPQSIFDLFPEATDFMDFTATQLSGGYLRIFEILLILLSQAPFCLLDEPFTGLTPVYIDRIKRILRETKNKKGILVTDHMHKHIEEIADRLYLLANGQTYHIRDREQLISLLYLSQL